MPVTALFVIAPEWHGMVPAALKNFFLLWAATGELSHKPALPCAVSAAEGRRLCDLRAENEQL